MIGILTFTTPDLSFPAKLIYAWVTYLLLRLVYTVNNVPYAALNGVMTEDPNERNSISSFRQMFANTAGFIVGGLAIPMVDLPGPRQQRPRLPVDDGFFLAVSVVLFLIAFAVSKERIQPDPQQQTFGEAGSGRPDEERSVDRAFSGDDLLLHRADDPRQLMLPYFKYCAGNQMLFSWFNGFGLTALLVGVACSTALTKRLGKRIVFFWSMLLTGMLAIALYFRRQRVQCSST